MNRAVILMITLILHYSWTSSSVRNISSCVDNFDIQKRGDSQLGNSNEMIVPQTYFSCNGKINGFIVSLSLDDNDDVQYPYIQVWRNVDPGLYNLVGQYHLQESDISRKQDYYLANVTLNGVNRIEFQSGDVIGYHHPSEPRYRVWNIENTRGYSIYIIDTRYPLSTLNIRGTSHLNVRQDRRPMIQVIYDIECENLLTPRNGEIISCSSGKVGVGYEGDTCNFTCNTGYDLTGSDTRTCQGDGSWSGTDVTCRRVSCQSLNEPANGMINCSLDYDEIPSFGDTCNFICNAGYKIANGSLSTCQSDGSWSRINVTCDKESKTGRNVFNTTLFAAIIGGIIAILLLLLLLLFCMLILHRMRKSSRNAKSMPQNHEITNCNFDITVNLDRNPSYHCTVNPNDHIEMNDHEYDEIVNENHIAEANSPYLYIVEDTYY